ncbi:MAG: type I glyceraldehyde-3-phosphate dehydrogenase [Bacteroidales bacterium]|nr:type I glyceraldehyde-3-phosphate dehydrogenase [Bacteroidales bacterium]
MKKKIAINGFGRIGRMLYRAFERFPEDIEVVLINDLTEPKVLAHLMKYDSVHGKYHGKIEYDEQHLILNDKKIPVFAKKDPAEIPHKDYGVEIVAECTGKFRKRADLEKHIKAGAQKVALSVPSDKKEDVDVTIVLGVNDHMLLPSHIFVSNASCTTNCLAPVVKVLHENFGIEHGFMNTIHAYTNDQIILDAPHKDLRRARAAGLSIIPTSTGAAKAIGLVIPELAGKLDGISMRVPVPDGSVVDLTATLKKTTTKEEINAAMKYAAENELKNILQYVEDPLVSVDIIGNPHSSIFDALLTQVIDGKIVKVIAWYDNEWGYSNRLAELIVKMSKLS